MPFSADQNALLGFFAPPCLPKPSSTAEKSLTFTAAPPDGLVLNTEQQQPGRCLQQVYGK